MAEVQRSSLPSVTEPSVFERVLAEALELIAHGGDQWCVAHSEGQTCCIDVADLPAASLHAFATDGRVLAALQGVVNEGVARYHLPGPCACRETNPRLLVDDTLEVILAALALWVTPPAEATS